MESNTLLLLPSPRVLLSLPAPKEDVQPAKPIMFIDDLNWGVDFNGLNELRRLSQGRGKKSEVRIDLTDCSIGEAKRFLAMTEVTDLLEVVERLGDEIWAQVVVVFPPTVIPPANPSNYFDVKVDFSFQHHENVRRLTALRAYREFHSMLSVFSACGAANFEIIARGFTHMPVSTVYSDHPKDFFEMLGRYSGTEF